MVLPLSSTSEGTSGVLVLIVGSSVQLRSGFSGTNLGQALLTSAQWWDSRPWAHTETCENPSEHKKMLFDLKSGQIQEQAAQRG